MLSKSLVVTFPLVLLLHAWWRRGRITRRDLRSSAPFFLVSVALGAATLLFEQRAIGVGLVPVLGPVSRLAVAGRALAFYLQKSVLPVGLLPIYPRWPLAARSPWPFLPWLALLGLVAWLWARRATWGRHGLFELGFFLLNLLPVLGFLPMSNQAYAWVADHFAYYALAGRGRRGGRRRQAAADRLGSDRAGLILYGSVLAVGAVLAVRSRAYARNFAGQESLWTYTVERNPDAWAAHVNLGNILDQTGRPTGRSRNIAPRLVPDHVEAHDNLGLALMHAGRPTDAAEQFAISERLRPADAVAHANRAAALANLGRWPEAIAEAEAAVRLEPRAAAGHDNLGNILARSNQPAAALAQYGQARQLEPGDAAARDYLGAGWFHQAKASPQVGQHEEAVAGYRRVLGLRPQFPEAELNLGNALFNLHRFAEAVGHYRTAVRLKPAYADAHYNLGLALRALGQRTPESAVEIEAARRLGADH